MVLVSRVKKIYINLKKIKNEHDGTQFRFKGANKHWPTLYVFFNFFLPSPSLLTNALESYILWENSSSFCRTGKRTQRKKVRKNKKEKGCVEDVL